MLLGWVKNCQISGMFLGGVKILSNTRYVAGRGSCLGPEGEIPEDNFLARHMLPTNLTTHFVDSNTLCVLLNIQVSFLKRGKTLIFSATSPAKVDVYQSKISLNHKYEILQKRVLLICNCSCSEVTRL